MAKFYCKSGSFETIIDAPDVNTAGKKITRRLLQSPTPHSLFVIITEQGFEHIDQDTVHLSLVPFFRETGVDMPLDEILIKTACLFLGLPTLSDQQTEWLLNGVEM